MNYWIHILFVRKQGVSIVNIREKETHNTFAKLIRCVLHGRWYVQWLDANCINWLMQCDFQMVTIQLVTSNQHENGILAIVVSFHTKRGDCTKKVIWKWNAIEMYRQNMWNVFQLLLKSYLMNRKSNVLLTDPDGPFELTQWRARLQNPRHSLQCINKFT